MDADDLAFSAVGFVGGQEEQGGMRALDEDIGAGGDAGLIEHGQAEGSGPSAAAVAGEVEEREDAAGEAGARGHQGEVGLGEVERLAGKGGGLRVHDFGEA